MATSRVDFSLRGIQRAVARVKRTAERANLVETRATTTLARRLGPEAARLISSDVLNLPASRVRGYLRVDVKKYGDSKYVTVEAARTRLPLILYTPRFNRMDGVTATTWRAQGPQRYPHAFKRPDGKPGVWQRVPTRRGAADLVARLPIVERKGPSMNRVFDTRGRYAGHGDITPKLSTFVEQTLALEIARLLRAS